MGGGAMGGGAMGGGAMGGGAMGGGAMGGGAMGGGAMGGGAMGGGATGGGSTGGGGSLDDGGTDAGCVPKTCPALPTFACGLLDDGCGHVLDCDLRDGGVRHSCASLTFCGAGTFPNLCTAPVSCSNGWCWENPLPQGNTLRAVWSTDLEQWAVGDVGTLLHFNGKYWKLAPSPTRSNLRAIAGRAANDLWAVGDDVILHYDGGTWVLANTVPGTQLRAVTVAPTGQVFAGGAGGIVLEGSSAGWMMQFNSPLDEVNALWAFDAGLLYAGGFSQGGKHAAVWTASSGSWATLSTTVNEVHALLGTPDGLLFAGADSCQLAQLNGSSLDPFTGGKGCDAGVLALAGTSGSDLVAAGPGFIVRLDGGPIELPRGDAGTWLGACAADAGRFTFVGENGLLAHLEPGDVPFVDSRGTAQGDVTSLFAIDGGELIGGSENGQIVQRLLANRAGQWTPLGPTVALDRITGVWASSKSDIWAVTQVGIIGHTQSGGFGVSQVQNLGLFAITHHLNNVQMGGSDGGLCHVPDGQLTSDFVFDRPPMSISASHTTVTALFSNGTQLFGATRNGHVIASDNGIDRIGDVPVAEELRAIHWAPGFLIAAGADGGVFAGPDNPPSPSRPPAPGPTSTASPLAPPTTRGWWATRASRCASTEGAG